MGGILQTVFLALPDLLPNIRTLELRRVGTTVRNQTWVPEAFQMHFCNLENLYLSGMPGIWSRVANLHKLCMTRTSDRSQPVMWLPFSRLRTLSLGHAAPTPSNVVSKSKRCGCEAVRGCKIGGFIKALLTWPSST